MKTLTKQQAQQVQNALNHAKRAMMFIQQDRIVVCSNRPLSSNDNYINKDGDKLGIINKQYGSDLTGLGMCIEQLESILAPKTQPTEIEL